MLVQGSVQLFVHGGQAFCVILDAELVQVVEQGEGGVDPGMPGRTGTRGLKGGLGRRLGRGLLRRTRHG